MGLKKQEKARLKNEEYMEDEANTNRDQIFEKQIIFHISLVFNNKPLEIGLIFILKRQNFFKLYHIMSP